MSLEHKSHSLQYAHKLHPTDVRFEETEFDVRIIFPKRSPTRAIIIGCTATALISFLLAIFFRTLFSQQDADVQIALGATLLGMVGIGLGVCLIVELTMRERHDELVVNVEGIRIEQWCQILERDVFLKWPYVSSFEFRTSEKGQRRELYIASKLGNGFCIVLLQPIASEKQVIDCLDLYRLIRADIDASVSDDSDV